MIYLRNIAVLFVLSTGLAVTSANANVTPELGYRQMYNLDFAAAHQTFTEWEHQNPDDPLGYVSNAAAYLFSEFDRLHILEVELFVNDSNFESRSKRTPDPAVRAAFMNELAKTDDAVAKVLAKSPADANALFAQVLSSGLRGDYAALIEKKNFASITYVKNARVLAEKLLAIHPDCYDAYLAVGIENYLLGSKPAPVRWFLNITGAQTNRDMGIGRLRVTADKGHYMAPFARLLLAVAAVRDHDNATARGILYQLSQEFPNNRLYAEQLAKIPA